MLVLGASCPVQCIPAFVLLAVKPLLPAGVFMDLTNKIIKLSHLVNKGKRLLIEIV